jgi:hypothetical protein
LLLFGSFQGLFSAPAGSLDFLFSPFLRAETGKTAPDPAAGLPPFSVSYSGRTGKVALVPSLARCLALYAPTMTERARNRQASWRRELVRTLLWRDRFRRM